MNKTLPFFLCLFSLVISKDWYISESRGRDSNLGTKESPFKTLYHANTVAGNSDTVFIEIGTYKQNIIVKTSLNLVGIPEYNSVPLLSGGIYFKGKAVAISNVNVESTNLGFYFSHCDTVKVMNVNFGPLMDAAMTFEEVRENIEIKNVRISNTEVMEIMGPTKVVNIDSLVVNNAQDNLEIIKVESLAVNNFLFGSSFGLRSVSVILSEIKSFTFSKTMLATSGNILLKIDNSNGVIEDSSISGVRRNNSQITNGGGLLISGGSNVKTKNLDLTDNESSNGGGFYCEKGTLNMIGGKIHGNKATVGGAGQCTASCSFSQVGVDLKDNIQTTPSDCTGLSKK
jgi:hypothetical protein